MARTLAGGATLAVRRARTGTIIPPNTPDVANGNYFVPTGAEILLLRNTAGASATLTLVPTADPYGAVGSGAPSIITVPAASWAAIGIIRPTGFIQSDGRIYFDASATTLRVYVVSLPQR